MRFKTSLALATLTALLLGSGISQTFAQSADDVPVMRYELKAPILFSPPSSEEPGGGDDGGPPAGGPSNGPPTITTAAGFTGWATVGDSFGALSITGGTPPYVTSLISGALPDGLQLNDNAIGGFYSRADTFTFTLRATDAANQRDDTDPIVVEVADPLVLDSYPQSVYQGTVGEPWSLPSPGISGGTPPYLFTGTGVTPDPATGAVALTPEAAGPIPLTLNVTDAHQRPGTASTTLNVSPQLTASAPAASTIRVGSAAVLPAPVVDGGRGTRSFSVVSGTLPPSMTAQPNGTVAGTPSETCSNCSYTLRITDVDNRRVDATVSYSTIAALTASVPSNAFSWRKAVPITPFTISASNNIAPVTFGVSGNALPSGISIDPITGVVSGTPTSTVGVTTTSFQAQETGNPPTIATTSAVTFNVSAPSVMTPDSQVGEEGVAWTTTPTYGNLQTGPNTRTFLLENAPSGMGIDASGVITWATPLQGTYEGIVVRVNDRDGSYGTKAFNLQILPPQPKNGGTTIPSVTASGNGDFGNPRIITYSYPVTVYVNRITARLLMYKTGGSPGMTWSLSSGTSASGPWTQIANGSATGPSSATSSSNAVQVGPNSAPFTEATGRWFRISFQANSGSNKSGSSPGLGTPEGMRN